MLKNHLGAMVLVGFVIGAFSIVGMSGCDRGGPNLSDSASGGDGDGGGDGGGGDPGGNDSLPEPRFAFEINQHPEIVIGQANFTSAATGSGADRLGGRNDFVTQSAVDASGRLFLVDRVNHRVLGYSSIPDTNDALANWVIGQPDFATVTSGSALNKMNTPVAVATGGGKLAIVERVGQRVLIFNSIPTASGATADVVVGTGVAGCAQNQLNNPAAVALADGKLIVSDGGNHRVLIWNTVPTVSNANADLVLGSSDGFATCGSEAISATSFARPDGLWSDGQKLVVADGNRNRVLIWNTFPTSNNVPADLVLGQNDFTTSGSGINATSFNGVFAVASDGRILVVSEFSSSRVVGWNSFPTTNGQAADFVLGVSNFTNGMWPIGGVPAIDNLQNPGGLFLFNGRTLIVGDQTPRFVVYQGVEQ